MKIYVWSGEDDERELPVLDSLFFITSAIFLATFIALFAVLVLIEVGLGWFPIILLTQWYMWSSIGRALNE